MDFFDVSGMDVEVVDPKPGDFYTQVVHIYLDEKDNRTEEFRELRPNGFTEPTAIEDFPIRDRKLVLHVRRRRWLDEQGHNVIINTYPLVREGITATLNGDDLKSSLSTTLRNHSASSSRYWSKAAVPRYSMSLSGLSSPPSITMKKTGPSLNV